MNSNVRYAVLALLVAAILLSLALHLTTPLLYALEKDYFPSPFHDNVEVLKLQSLNSTTDILPQIQDEIDFPGPISLSIRIHDIEQAKRDLERFENSHGSLKNLIVRLDMNESEIHQIETNTALQKEILDSLLNTTVSLDSLQLMEIQYHEQNNPDMLTTIRLKGNELRKKVHNLRDPYHKATENVVAVATKFGLTVNETRESEREVDQIIQEIEQPQTTALIPVNTALTPGEERVSLFLRPEKGIYRDIIEYMGISLTLRGNTTIRAEGKPIVLSIDDQPAATILTDAFGYYNVKLPIDRIRAGTHIAYVRSPTSRSVNRTLTVFPVDSVTNLTVSRPDRDGNVNCTGSVLANYPVRSASVQITWDETHILIAKTDPKGFFMREIQLPPGRHILIASFSGDGYPINPSQSEIQVVEVSLIRGLDVDTGLVLLVISVAGILLLFLGGAVYYLRRMTRVKKFGTEAPAGAGPAGGPDAGILPVPGQEVPADEAMRTEEETLIAYYTRILMTRGLSAASRSVYMQLAGRIAHDLGIRRHRTLTAREMAKNCRQKPYCGAFARFVGVYERIRYGGPASVKDQGIFETAIHSTAEQMGGDDH